MDGRAGILQLRLIGAFAASVDGFDLPIRSMPARLVLAALALSPERAERRSRLAGMLWERTDEAGALRNLRQAVHQLRLALDGVWGDAVTADRTTIRLDPARLVTDYHSHLAMIGEGAVPEDALRSPPLHERLMGDLPEQGELHGTWLRLKRGEFETALRMGLERVAAGTAPEAAERAAVALLQLDPSNEVAARRLMTLAAGRGDTGRALSVYAALWDHLDDVYGMEPSPETQDLVTRIKCGEVIAPPEAAGRTAAPGGPPAVLAAGPARQIRIGVDHVSVEGIAPDHAGLARIFRAELVARLARFREIEVHDLELSEREVDYRLRLYGTSIRDALSLVAVLIRVPDGAVIWSDRSEGLAESWWDHQARLAGRIAAAASLTVSRARLAETERLSRVRGAVDNWLLGQKLIGDFRADSDERAAACFREAIALDPEYSPAYSSLAQLINGHHLRRPGVAPDPKMLREGRVLANRAVSLDPMDARAHLHRGWSNCMLRDFGQAESCFVMARQCNESDPWVMLSSALGTAFIGDYPLAEALARRCLIDEGWTTRRSHWGYHASIRFLIGDDAGCIEAAENAGTGILNIPAWKAAAHWWRGEADEAREAWELFETQSRANWAAPGPPGRERIWTWFSACFPIRDAAAHTRLVEGASRAAGLGAALA